MRKKFFLLHILSQLLRKDLEYINKYLLQKNEKVVNQVTFDFFFSQILDSKKLEKYLDSKKKIFSKSFFIKCVEQNEVFMKLNNTNFCSYDDELYPQLLKYIDSYPAGIFARGNNNLLNKDCISVIGSRKAPYKNLKASYEISAMLSECGYTIVSGGAYGCDIAAHKGALESKSQQASTVVVLAGALDQIYPRGNLSVFKKILDNEGLLVSEKIINSKIYPSDFPVRNRIISGLSKKLIVMAAGDNSGAMLTVRNALDQGRDVLVYDSQSIIYQQGIETLIEDGAFVFTNYNELIDGFLL